MTVWSHCPAQAFSRSYAWLLGLISSREYNKSWDALREERSPAQLLLFAHCKINGREEKNNKDIEELYCKISTKQQNMHIGHQGQRDNMESREQRETGRNK